MAAVENLSEVIKDSDKEHVSTSRKEISSENAKLINGEAEIERCVSFRCVLLGIPSYISLVESRIFCNHSYHDNKI